MFRVCTFAYQRLEPKKGDGGTMPGTAGIHAAAPCGELLNCSWQPSQIDLLDWLSPPKLIARSFWTEESLESLFSQAKPCLSSKICLSTTCILYFPSSSGSLPSEFFLLNPDNSLVSCLWPTSLSFLIFYSSLSFPSSWISPDCCPWPSTCFTANLWSSQKHAVGRVWKQNTRWVFGLIQ